MTQKALAEAIGVASNYIYMIEAGRKPLTDAVREQVNKLDRVGRESNLPIKAPPVPVPDPACHYPEGLELKEELASLSHRMSVMEGQLDTVIRLLGPILRTDSLDQYQPKTKAG